MKHLIVVESPTKAKTLTKILPKNFVILSTMGHIRDLPNSSEEIPKSIKNKEWASMGVDYNNGFLPYYVISRQKMPFLKKIKESLKKSDSLVLATDSDREGESISWHLVEVLKPKIPIKRIVFQQITKESVLQALDNYRQINQNLVFAQETRRILDRIFGYTLSPLLWKKITYKLSAGRVQSVAMNLVVEREIERMNFKSVDYYGLVACLQAKNITFESLLIKVNEKPLASGKDFDPKTGKLIKNSFLLDENKAEKILQKIKNSNWLVKDISVKTQEKKPTAPFITSSLQQESAYKLRFSSKETMSIAQSLYEKGYITYMRTDSVIINPKNIQKIRGIIEKKFGKDYLPKSAYLYKNKSKNAQEAHEAIHPVNLFLEAKELKENENEKKLYDLIWKKTIASQMSVLKKEFLHLDIKVEDFLFRSTGKKTIHQGYHILYQDQDQDEEQKLPELKLGEQLTCKKVEKKKHSTLPPSRYNEASLIKFLEQKDIGRPSTYASIISTIIEREYVKKQNNYFIPTFTAFSVSKLLKDNFPDLINVTFTAKIETVLDEIANGKAQQKNYLENFFNGKKGLLQKIETKNKEINKETYKKIQLPNLPEIKISSYGPYFNMGEKKVNIPNDCIPGNLTKEYIQELIKNRDPNAIGIDPTTKKDIFLLQGKYGPYLQLGLAENDEKPKRVSLSTDIVQKGIDLSTALILLSLPIFLGEDTKTKGKISINTGKYGPYLVLEKSEKKEFRSLKLEEIENTTLAQAIKIFSQKKIYSKKNNLIKIIGKYPVDDKDIELYSGRYGIYLKYKNKNFSIPKNKNSEKITLAEAIQIIQQKSFSKK